MAVVCEGFGEGVNGPGIRQRYEQVGHADTEGVLRLEWRSPIGDYAFFFVWGADGVSTKETTYRSLSLGAQEVSVGAHCNYSG